MNMNIKNILLTILLTLLSTTALASRTYYATFEGCFENEVGNTPLTGNECYTGRVGFEQQTADQFTFPFNMTVTEFWFEVDGERLDIEDISIDEDYANTFATDKVLGLNIYGTAPFAGSELSFVGLGFNLIDDVSHLSLEFGSWDDQVYGSMTGGTIMHYPGSAPLEKMNVGLNDAWYEPATAGAGIFVTVLPVEHKAFGAWYTYDNVLPIDVANVGDAGHRYLTGVGDISGNRVIIDIDVTSNGLFDTPNSEQQVVWTPEYGVLILTFDTCETGTLQYSIPSANEVGIVPLQRVALDNVGLCQKLQIEGGD